MIAAHTFDVFLYELFAPLLAGGVARLVTTDELYDHGRMAALLRSATAFQAVPGVMEHLLTTMAGAGPHFGARMVMTGGDAVPPDLLDRVAEAFPAAEVIVTYGPTETTVFCTRYRTGAARPRPGGRSAARCRGPASASATTGDGRCRRGWKGNCGSPGPESRAAT